MNRLNSFQSLNAYNSILLFFTFANSFHYFCSMEAYNLDNEPRLRQQLANFVGNLPQTYTLRTQSEARVEFRPRDSKLPSYVQLSAQQKGLPVYAHHDRILRAIQKNNVTIISGSTGSGKTTQIVQYILNDYAQLRAKVSILCTQPRRLAVISAAKRVAMERKTELGNEVGYQIKGETMICQNTSLIFMTR